jgi:phospholipase A1/A2
MTFNPANARTFISISLAASMLFPLACAAGDVQLQCAGKADNIERLECYDTLNAARLQEKKSPEAVKPAEAPATVARSYLTRSWDLDNKDEELLGEHQSPLKPHRVSYLIARRTSEINKQPYTPTHAPVTLPVDIDLTEVKFQFSQKARVLNSVKTNFLGITSFRLWGAYTQQSSWQAFNSGNSSPFRETIYEPELILTMSTGNQSGLKLINLGYVHQSNGRNTELSRSWNRFYLQGGWESDTLSALARGWWRIPETADQDDNPDIVEHIGRGEITLRWAPLDGSQLIGLTLRNNLRVDQNRSFMQLDWATPVSLNQSAKLHVQLTSGYGESLIDYNFKQTTLGIGVSFRDW